MNKIKKVLFSTFPRIEQEQFSKEVAQKNYTRSVTLSKILLVVSLLMYIIAVIESDLKIIKDLNLTYFLLCLVIFILFVILKPKNNNPGEIHFILFIFLVVVNLIWGSSLMAFAPNRYEMYGTYSIIIISMSTIFYIKWKLLFTLYFSSLIYIFVVFVIDGDFFFIDPVIPKITVIISLNALAIVVSRMLYYNYLENFELNTKLQSQNIKIGLEVESKTKKLIESESNLKTAQSIAKVGSWELDLENMSVWGSEEAFKIFELERTNEFLDWQFILSMVNELDREIITQTITDLIQLNKVNNVTVKLNTATGKVKYVNSRASLKFDQDHKPIKVVGVILDITNLKEKELELEFSAYNDFLTGLHNRRFYEEKLDELDEEGNYPITIVMADINGLKLINDAFGHSTGDELLISAANLIADNCRETDLLARIGGDEFVIIMPKTDEKTAEQLISNINKKAKLIETQSIPLSISFGYKAKTLESEEIQDVYRSAEDLMYREKLLEIPSMRSSAIETILNTLYEKDVKSEVHSRSVSQLSERLAIAYGMDRQDVAEVKTAGLLHDIGKIIISSSIINKEGKLTQEEYSVMKTHPEIGFRILNSTQDMREISTIVLNHHERWDGEGYPRGIKAEDIPLKSRIISIADAFDAMTSERTYRDTISKKEALKEMLDNAGTQFDAALVNVFKEHFAEITAE